MILEKKIKLIECKKFIYELDLYSKFNKLKDDT